ncbi:hypothetical protein JHK85_039389 [Glycine max]|nr:hypothetical protein JHK85_039389 [Glycine max]
MPSCIDQGIPDYHNHPDALYWMYTKILLQCEWEWGRCDGSEVKFDENAVVLVDKQRQPIGTRVFGTVPHEFRQKKHVKILTLAGHIA